MNPLRSDVRVFVLFALCLLLVCSIASAQVITGTILGTVSDPSGSPLPGVSITARNQETGQTRMVLTDSSGTYRVSALSLGPYEVKAELEGFQSTLRKGIVLTVGREAVVNFKLSLARMSETVVV